MASCKLWHCPSFSPLRSLSPSCHTSQKQLLQSPRCGIRSTHQVNLSISCHGDAENGRNGAVAQREDHDEEEEDGKRGIKSSVGGVHFGRREAFAGFVVAGMLVGSPGRAGAYTQVEVGTYLPPAEDNTQYVQFKASTKDTPALRAGNVQPYEFILPPTWKQVRIANILSGNYCQPKCAEPWVEVKFENPKQGTVQVVASPMVRLTNKLNATIEEIGNPEKLIAALGPFVTGNSYDPDEVLETSVQHRGNQTYYTYQLQTPFARTGTHNLAIATAKGSVVLLCVVSANDSQWASSEPLLKEILNSFTA
ncbi:unnamed protein product [Sphagnum troendelagicum]|uniref:PsbP C-terminal domain-containing protein n=1 Tax=Sphagnum troendelagicum TaxID=128251 RepID=A0ABP0U0B9_9BRYO